MQDARNKKFQAKNARMMISVELSYNIEQLKHYYKGLTQETSLGQTRTLAPQEIASVSTKFPLPTWSHKMWESQLEIVPSSLSYDEISRVHEFHVQLDTITAIQKEACRREEVRQQEASQLEREDLEVFDPTSVLARATLTTLTMLQLGERLQRIMEDLIQSENPVPNATGIAKQGKSRGHSKLPSRAAASP